MLACAAISAQDTLCVMLTQKEVIYFDFKSSEILSESEHPSNVTLSIEKGQVLCLHLYDEDYRVRDVVTTFDDGSHRHDLFESKDNVFFSDLSWGSFEINVSESKRKK